MNRKHSTIVRTGLFSLLILGLHVSYLFGQIVPISSIQGTGRVSPLLGEVVAVEGVVAQSYLPDAYGPRLGGFFIVEEEVDRDADPESSEGIFIYFPDLPAPVSRGEVVRVTGRVTEYETGDGASSLTELSGISSFVRIGTTTVPEPVSIFLPADHSRLESFEGMNVRVENRMVVVENRSLGFSGELRLAPPPSYPTIPADRPVWPTAWSDPGSEAFERLGVEIGRTIAFDDGEATPWSVRAPDRSTWGRKDVPRTGTLVDDLEGIVDDRFGEHRLQPVADRPPTWLATPAGAAPNFGVEPSDTEVLRIASFNVGNFFLTLPNGESGCGPQQNLDCRGAETVEEQERQGKQLTAALRGLDADIIGLVEIENTTGVDAGAWLAAELGKGPEAEEYRTVVTGTIGTDAIRSGFLYRPERVEPVGEVAILDGSVDDRFHDRYNRPSIAQRFRSKATGGTMTVVVNHFKSKGSDCDGLGDLDRNDGQGECNGTRRLAAEALADWIASDPTGSDDPDYLIVGDFNAYTMEDPIRALARGGDGQPGTDDDLVRLVPDTSSGRDGPLWSDYTYGFNGMVGALDHAFTSRPLLQQVVGMAPWHINVDESPMFDYRIGLRPPAQLDIWTATPERSSDHDPVIVAVRLRSDSATTDVPGGVRAPSELELTSRIFTIYIGAIFGHTGYLSLDLDGNCVEPAPGVPGFYRSNR